ncbi:MAG: L-threonylcarbamoyladenylate synthase [Coriobacteriaceae bacterium]
MRSFRPDGLRGGGGHIRFRGESGDPRARTGYGRIFTLKQRELTRQCRGWSTVSGPRARGKDVFIDIALAEKLWPGALTLVVPAADDVPPFMRAADGTVALRASASPVVQELIARCGSPLAVTSANTHGKPAPISFDEVEPRILAGVDVAVDAGETPCRDASTIVAVRDGELQILREGALAVREIRAVLE